MTTTSTARRDGAHGLDPAPHHEEGAPGAGRSAPASSATRPATTSARSTSSRRCSGSRPTAPCCTRWSRRSWPPSGPGRQSTKTRAEVRGGGAKPFRQKGTGRARQGSSRSPSMSGGGVALGPKPRSYEQRTPKKMVRLALLSALSDMAETGGSSCSTDWEIEEPDTRAAAVILQEAARHRHGARASWPTTRSTWRSRCATSPRPRSPRTPSSRPTTSCGPTGSSSPSAPCPASPSDFSGTH